MINRLFNAPRYPAGAMARPSVPAAAALLLAAAAGVPALASDGPSIWRKAQLFIQQRILVRVRPPAPATTTGEPVRWTERKGPKCVALDRLAGALVQEGDSVDLVLQGGQRVRARLGDECAARNFYAGFYLRPAADGQLCAGRDAVHLRTGRTCPIDAFRRLVAAGR